MLEPPLQNVRAPDLENKLERRKKLERIKKSLRRSVRVGVI
jgi:hypothetical protein